MIKVKMNFKSLPIAVASLALVVSCSNDKEDPMGEQEFSQAEVNAVLAGDDMTSFADNTLANLAINGSGSAGTTNKVQSAECYSYIEVANGFTVTFANCSLEGHENITGNVEVEYAAGEGTASFTATFDDLNVDGTIISGTRSYVFKGDMEQGVYTFSITSDMRVGFPDDSFYSEKGTQNYSLVFGETWETSTYTISGNWNVEWKGNTYNLASAEGIQGNLTCADINKGILEISKNGLNVSVNYGDGTCDDMATLVYPDGTTEEFTLDK
ncbi:hypothetical protein K8352_00925 [Flavobacteriaceae bacterium F89]|uniref:Lipoprotein n=1 Tax=Cerina litoralis TaxID=2874477 RepID=A0AAE3ESD9_9FLAO|nr:hypothetical protein [Cerina litoralis]MCG2459304.1 hypothetical protein [Cerina litoralis]